MDRLAGSRRLAGTIATALAALALAAPAGSRAASSQPAVGAASEQQLIRTIVANLRAAGGNSGVWIADATSGEPLYTSLGDVRRMPASVEKLLTTSTALERFGEHTRLETAIAGNGALDEEGVLDGDLYLRGAGDPSFDRSDLERLADRLVDLGLERVRGRVLGDDSLFDRHRGLPWAGFRVSIDVGPLSALSFHEGTVPGSAHLFQRDPPRYVASRLDAALGDRYVRVDGAPRVGRLPPTATTLASVSSPKIAALVRHANQVSDNYYAETLLKGLGARFGGRGSTSAGAAIVRRYERSIGVEATVLDGSGLSRGDAISPHAVVRLLDHAQQEPWFPSFYRSLPLAARTGTLRKRMRRSPAAGRCRAKTGTLRDVSALAGYCNARGGRRFMFALLMNGVNVGRARLAQDRIAAALAR